MKPVGVSYLLLLSSIGLAQAQNCSTPDAGPHMHLNDNDIIKTTFADGSETSFVCETGYIRESGSQFITCTAGIWSKVTLICERMSCGSPGEIDNGHFDFEGIQFGDKAVAVCNPGFILVGKGERICSVNGWTGRVPTCEVVVCDPPPPVENVAIVTPQKESYDYRDVIQYRCQKDYTLNGSQTITCSEDGNFKPSPPKCIQVNCEPPNIPNAEWDGGARPPYGHKAYVTYRCTSGHVMEGASGLTCEINGQWSPELPVCRRLTTTTKATTTTTSTTATITPRPPAKTPQAPEPPSPTDPPGNDGSSLMQTVIIVVAVVVLLAGAGLSYWIYGYIKKSKKKNHSHIDYTTNVPQNDELEL